ncbi:MAG: ribonuclease M5 [Anaerovoracaceae bacterium]
MEKIKVSEIIVVEGRDDTAAVNMAVTGMTIETHGFGIRKETWALLEKAYIEKGLIIFTDPDYSGEEIRRKLTAKFPKSKQAYLPRAAAIKGTDIGIENAIPEDIIEALTKAHYTVGDKEKNFDEEDLIKYGLVGQGNSKAKREKLGALLGIGYGNSKAFLKKLNTFNIEPAEFAAKAKEL